MLKKGLLISLVIVFVLVIIKDEKRYNIKQEIFNYNLYQECPYKLKIKSRKKGKMVNIKDTLTDVKDILEGKYDEVDESSLLYRGSLNE